jgi:hypothetical protein
LTRRRYEYQVCSVQQARVTFVNGAWQGSVAPGGGDHEAALQSCPAAWDYLEAAGYDGWELAGAVAHQTGQAGYEVLYLKRER